MPNPFDDVVVWHPLAPVVFTPDPDFYDRERTPMSEGERETFRAFAAYANDDDVCFPSQDLIADDLDVCLKTVQRRVKRLIEGGHMRIAERRWSPFSRHRHNVYQLLSLDLCPVSDLARKRIIQRAHSRFGHMRNRARQSRFRRGCPTKRTVRAFSRGGECGCWGCKEDRADYSGPNPVELARRRWRPAGVFGIAEEAMAKVKAAVSERTDIKPRNHSKNGMLPFWQGLEAGELVP
jgi:hypothetical protein